MAVILESALRLLDLGFFVIIVYNQCKVVVASRVREGVLISVLNVGIALKVILPFIILLLTEEFGQERYVPKALALLGARALLDLCVRGRSKALGDLALLDLVNAEGVWIFLRSRSLEPFLSALGGTKGAASLQVLQRWFWSGVRRAVAVLIGR